jgi:hypothetical protein
MPNWIATEIADGVELNDAARVAHRLGGIIANNDRVRTAIQEIMEVSAEESDFERCDLVLSAVAKVLEANSAVASSAAN